MAYFHNTTGAPGSERERNEGFGPVVAWQGGQGWTGEAHEAFRLLNFLAVPWEELRRPGMERDGMVCVKIGGTRQVLRVADPRPLGATSGQSIYVKRYRVNTFRRRLGNMLSGGKTRREFRLGQALLRRGIPTAVPLAYARAQPGWNFGRPATFLATLGVEHAGSLLDWSNEGRTQRTPEIFAALARFLAEMHGRGFVHDDCSARNIFVAQGADFERAAGRDALGLFVIMDLDHGRLSGGPAPLRGRALNLCQIMRHLRNGDLASAEARRNFLRDYLTASNRTDPRYRIRLVRLVNRFAQRKFGERLIEDDA